jgi:CDP-paratose 2-epimerase
MRCEYVDEHRKGDHICYISDLSKAMAHYPRWSITKPVDAAFEEMYQAWRERLVAYNS